MPDLVSAQFSNVEQSFTILSAVPYVMRVPCPVPVQTSFGTMFDRPAVFLEVTDDQGNTGLGEVWCNFPSCGAEHRARLLESAIFPALLGVRFDSPDHCFAVLEKQFARLAIQAGEPGPIAQCIAGVDVALWDLVARRAGVPLFRLLGGENATIPAYASGINPANAAQTVERCRAQGHRAFKLKIGFDRDKDLANIAQISTALGSDEMFMVDANQAWSVDEARDILPALAGFSLGWLEEPIMADRPTEEWLTLALASTVPLAAGENMINAQDFARGISRPAIDVIQPDLCKWGGISGVLPVAKDIIASGKRYCPHYLGGGIGLAASAHVLAAVGGDGMLEIDSNDNPLRNTLFDLPITQGQLTLPDTPGLGVAGQFAILLASDIGKGRLL
ncbi:mandelate racemase/muconate lactonizing enzyme family protein [Rhodobacterales bacterium FZCC0083]|nr:mandelate racemase/muconate lactonizing enzyme family protein [Rhodobacterales bacterium FZCC0083]